jgi:hypothetical protein
MAQDFIRKVFHQSFHTASSAQVDSWELLSAEGAK